MYKYVIKRLIWIIPIILGVTFIVFSIISLTPGDPARLILGSSATEEAVTALRVNMGLEKPMIIRYFDYLMKAITGDFGKSYLTGQPVMNDIFKSWPITITIAFYSTILGSLLAIPLGIFAALRHRGAFDIISTVVSMIIVATPTAAISIILLLVFSLYLKVLPASGIESWKNYVMPVSVLLSFVLTSLMRLVRTTMLDTIKQDYITTIRAKGAPERVVVLRHAFKNVSLMVVTQIGMTFSSMLAGAVLVEQIFGMPGLGSLVLKSIRAKDIPSIMGTTIVLSLVVVFTVLILDIVYAYIDPRIRAKYAGGK